MRDIILFLAEIVNNVHDVLIVLLNDMLGLQLTDKDMHFWIMGIIGIITFAVVYMISKWLSQFKIGIHLIAFLYTLTFMFVLVFAIEIQQAITNRGNMDFIDAIIGLWGYIVLFLVYLGVILFVVAIKAVTKKLKNKKNITM
ncbi:hypothetical protein FS935_08470 [Metabacillus litoralis]|uniref:Uncharacterized protein n=1 Tax=Metabacillus litoralis TaxID=152268 RepID=A0A5C6W518_9BACI|nr:hypothetical protein [Metabacillus litoralis]TXC90931.1 hypothetical protein FS935_08470 [Metabacillus litoralis]